MQGAAKLHRFIELALHNGPGQLFESLTALGQRIGRQLGYFLENLLPLSLTLFGLGFGTGSPAGQGFLGGAHMTDNLLPQRSRRTAKGSDRLVENADIELMARWRIPDG